MRDAEMVIWLGDFNYRIELSFEVAKEKARRKLLTELLAKVRVRHAQGPLGRNTSSHEFHGCVL